MLYLGGAEVIKVEPPQGDPLCRWAMGRHLVDDEDGTLFQFLASGKQSVVLDPMHGPDIDSPLALLSTTNVIVWGEGYTAVLRR
jgi:crotonobetainyl-CoA:carnitine CoA-transferase CaiB-like acyl-CoA transferase